MDALLTDTPLIVSELVTNSVRHAGPPSGGTVRVRARLAGGRLRLEVEDPGRDGPSRDASQTATVAVASA